MSENTTTSKSTEAKNGDARIDLTTPFHHAMAFWRGEVERFTREAESAAERTVMESRRLLDEGHRMMAAQLDASREATLAFADAMRRFSRIGERA